MRWIGVMLLMALRAAAQPSAGTVAGPGGESHGWVARSLSGGEERALVAHLPPRRDWSRADGVGDVEDGSIRPALQLRQMPERLGAWDDDLWIVFAPESSGGKSRRRVLRMSVERHPLGGAWSSPEAEGRLPSMPSLPGEKALVGFAGTPRGPAALLRSGGEGAPEFSLLLGNDLGWRELPLPVGLHEGVERLDLAAGATGPVLIATGAGRCTVWQGAFLRLGVREADVPAFEWMRGELSMEVAGGGRAPAMTLPPLVVGGQVVFVSRDGAAVDVWNPTKSGCRLLARVGQVRGELSAVPLDGVGRLALVCDEPGPPPPGATHPGTRVVEVSVFSGAVLFDGPANVRGPVSATELKLLAIVLVGMMAIVLIVVLRPEGANSAVSLPAGLALAEPGRRIAAGAIDLGVALVLVALARRVSPTELFSPAVLLTDPAGVQTVLMVLGAGVIHSAVGEWLIGRTVGKALTGCATMAVVRPRVGADGAVEPVLVRPSLWRALVRNLVRWALAPVAIAGLNGADHRHRGDVAAGTVVVVRLEDEAGAA